MGTKHSWRWWFIEYYPLIHDVFSIWCHWVLINSILKCKLNFWKRLRENRISKNWRFVKDKSYLAWNDFDVDWWREILKEILVNSKSTFIYCSIVAFNHLFSLDFTWHVLANKCNYLHTFDFANCSVFHFKFENYEGE